MRGILVDWVLEIHFKFGLASETLFLAVHLIDRFLEKEVIMRDRLQLVAVACLFIASKYEDVMPPTIADFEYVSNNIYSREEILNMECKVLATLEFEINFTSSFIFLQRLRQVAQVDSRTWNFARYLIELTLLEQCMLRHKPS